MSDFCVILVLKISHPSADELLTIKNFASLELEHSETDTYFKDRPNK